MSIRQRTDEKLEDYLGRHTMMICRSTGDAFIIPLVEGGLPTNTPDRAERDEYYRQLRDASDASFWTSRTYKNAK
jgi:hypothetical protein